MACLKGQSCHTWLENTGQMEDHDAGGYVWSALRKDEVSSKDTENKLG